MGFDIFIYSEIKLDTVWFLAQPAIKNPNFVLGAIEDCKSKLEKLKRIKAKNIRLDDLRITFWFE